MSYPQTIKYSFESKDLDEMLKELLQCHNMTQEEWMQVRNKLNGRLKDVERELHELAEQIKEERLIAQKQLQVHDEMLQDHETRLQSKKKLLEQELKDITLLHDRLDGLEIIQKKNHDKLLEKVDNKFEQNGKDRREENRTNLIIMVTAIGVSIGVISGILILILDKII
jgi:Fe2+ transport system protein B